MKLFFAFRLSLILITVSCIFNSCKKEITVPNENDKEIFQRWTWIKTDGGLAAGISSPATTGYKENVEFTSKGMYYRYRNGSEKEKLKFSIATESSSIFGTTRSIISYKKTGLFNNKNTNDFLKQSFEFKDDSLILHEEVSDGLVYYFIKT